MLVCTTIIESGLDIPNVNTIIIDNADRFGLAQLYQLRGRVGRGANRAYAYFLYTRDGTLTEMAEERLQTIFEATELGAGFRIAMKDLEIRGAGNLLGAEQHGHIAAVGFDLYCRLLGEAVDSLRALRTAGDGQPAVLDGTDRLAESLGTLAPAQPAGTPAKLTLPLAAFLPADYVADEAQRLRLYQRLANIWSYAELGAFMDELEDRYGPLPEPAHTLVYLVRLRVAATEAGHPRDRRRRPAPHAALRRAAPAASGRAGAPPADPDHGGLEPAPSAPRPRARPGPTRSATSSTPSPTLAPASRCPPRPPASSRAARKPILGDAGSLPHQGLNPPSPQRCRGRSPAGAPGE